MSWKLRPFFHVVFLETSAFVLSREALFPSPLFAEVQKGTAFLPLSDTSLTTICRLLFAAQPQVVAHPQGAFVASWFWAIAVLAAVDVFVYDHRTTRYLLKIILGDLIRLRRIAIAERVREGLG